MAVQQINDINPNMTNVIPSQVYSPENPPQDLPDEPEIKSAASSADNRSSSACSCVDIYA